MLTLILLLIAFGSTGAGVPPADGEGRIGVISAAREPSGQQVRHARTNRDRSYAHTGARRHSARSISALAFYDNANAGAAAAAGAAGAALVGAATSTTVGATVAKIGGGAVAAESALDVVGIGVGAVGCAGRDASSCAGAIASTLDLAAGPNLVGDAVLGRNLSNGSVNPGKVLNAAKGGAGRGASHLKPDPKAQGPHSTFKTDPQTDKVTGHAEWQPNPKNPSGFDQAKRVDVTGDPHFNKATRQDVPTPHTHEKGVPGGVRPARPDEVP